MDFAPGREFFFYASWNPKYIAVLLAVTAIGYVSGRVLEYQTHPTTRRFILSLSLLASLGIFFLFKYFDLSNRALHAVFDRLGIGYGVYLILPLGLSYFTFQTLSYIINVYRGIIKAERHAGIYALFIGFFQIGWQDRSHVRVNCFLNSERFTHPITN